MSLATPTRFAVLLCALALAPAMHALEHITLRNGFTYDCARHEDLDAGHVRLYLYSSPATGSRLGYIDLATRQIVLVETLPDPPPSPPSIVAPAVPPVVAPAAPTQRELAIPQLLTNAGAQHNIDVELLASVVHAESGGRTTAVSRTGARGLMQLMPATAADLGVTDPTRADQNINGGTTYLDALLTRYHDNLSLALAAYNAGPAAVDRYHGVPPYRETRAYVARVESEFKRRKLATHRAPAPSASGTTLASR